MGLAAFARQIRLDALELCFRTRTSHIGGAFSVADILAALYGQVLSVDPQNPTDPERDRLFYSKGHACTALYAALEIRGFFEKGSLAAGFIADGSSFTSHVNHNLPGIELSTGSLGHALGAACGSALAGKRRSAGYTVFVVVSDGELDEGANWEAILFAAHHRLDNLVVVVDYNRIQSFGPVDEVLSLEPLSEKFRSFNWSVNAVDGHALDDLSLALSSAKQARAGRPKCIIANTVKGRGVSFMEGRLAWHYKSPSDAEYSAARLELGGV
jgi:transketolase